MSGHSKWSKIKHTKQAKDAAKSSVFAKLARLITLAVIEGGGMTDPALSVRLRLAIDKAKAYSLPKDNINRAIAKGSGSDRTLLKEVRYEAFGPHGVALLILATTDNPNRTISEVRNVLERHSGKLAGQGAVGYLFQSCGVVTIDNQTSTEEQIFTFAQQVDALDIEQEGKVTTIYLPYAAIGKVKAAAQGLSMSAPEHIFRPLNPVTVESPDTETKIIQLVEALEELEDVHAVHTNLNLQFI